MDPKFWSSMDDSLRLLLGAGIGILFLIFALQRPTTFVLLAVWVIIFADTLEWITKLGLFSYADEAAMLFSAVVFPARRLLMRQRLIWIRGYGWLLIFLIVGLVGNFIHQTPLSVAGLGLAVTIKGFLFAFGVAQLDWQEKDIVTASRGLWIVGSVVILGGVLNVLFPSAWAQIFSPSQHLDTRYGIPSLIGPFVHPGSFAIMLGLIAVATLAYRRLVKKSALSAFLLIGSLAGSLLALRRRIWAALVVGVGIVMMRTSPRVVTVISLIIFVPIFGIAIGDFLGGVLGDVADEYLSDSAQVKTARTVITLDSFGIANAGILVGVGFGRFGSWIAALTYSPEYSARGYEHVWGLGPLGRGESNFLLDTFWPAIVGETGWGGMIAFCVMLFVFGRRFLALSSDTEQTALVRCLGLTGVGWLLFFVLDSVASPAFFSSLAVLFYAVLGIAASFSNRSPGVTDPTLTSGTLRSEY